MGLVSFFSLLKAFISFFYKGYIPDRLIFYAIFSPKTSGYFWFSAAFFIFLIFIYFRKRIENFSTFKFLLTLYIIFVFLAVSIAAIREGFYGVYEPFTRTRWEYSGNLPLITSAQDFIKDYSNLKLQLALHSRWHPPGYSLILYAFQKVSWPNLAGISLLVVMLGGLTIFLLYYLLCEFASEAEARRGIQIFALVPSFLMFSATSMETTFLFFSFIAFVLIYFGVKKNLILAFAGGVLAGFSLFSNFLFLLLTPLYLLLIIYALFNFSQNNFKTFARAVFAALGFILFFLALKLWAGYSVINDFFDSYKSNAETVSSNFESIRIYFIYFFINLAAFCIYLGFANIYLILKNVRNIFREKLWPYLVGFFMLAIFLLVGIFQGEIERIWLFITPLFILPVIYSGRTLSDDDFSSVLSMLFFQIIFMQVLFYTYW